MDAETSPVRASSSMVADRSVAERPVVDTQDILGAAAAMPEQLFAALEAASDLDGLPDHDDIENVVVLGMGGSAAAGDVLLAAASPYVPVPMLVFRSYNVPAFVGEKSLVFAISFSGDTEETLEATTEAAAAGARIVAVTRGGELARLARSWDAPVVAVPAGIPQPRTGLAALAIPPLVVLEEVGLFPGARQWITAAGDQLSARRDQLVLPDNPAEKLAWAIGRTMAIVHGGGGLGATAAARWKTDINENAKAPAFWNTQPELCHNEVSGWGQHGDLTRQAVTLVALRHDYEHPQVARRFELTARLLDEVVAGVHEVVAEGDGELAQLLDLVLMGEFTSIHMALQEGIDPGPIPAQDSIKAELAQGGTEPQ